MNMITKRVFFAKTIISLAFIGIGIFTWITKSDGMIIGIPLAFIVGLNYLAYLFDIATGRLKVVNEYPPAVQKQIAEAEAEMNKELEKESQESFEGLIIGYPFGSGTSSFLGDDD